MQYEIGQTYQFKFAQLIRSAKYNVRSKQERSAKKYLEGLEELAALILAQGLLQNMIGFQQTKGKRFLDIIEIVGGGRRFDAIALLVERKLIDPETFDIEVRICSVSEALAKSLTENSGREALPPADQYRAFTALIDNGQSTEEIATAFGVDEVTIKRRLKLAKVSPRIFDLYEEGTATLDQLMALALTDDHAMQERLWDTCSKWDRTANNFKRLITSQEICVANSKVARFVGLEEYEAAGGEVRRDLFSDEGNCYLKDAPLLESLAVAKLERLTPTLKTAGWAWVDYCTSFEYDDERKFSKVQSVQAPMTEVQQAAYDALQERANALQEQLDAYYDSDEDEDNDEGEGEDKGTLLQNEIEKLESEMQLMDDSRSSPDPAYAAVAGVVVSLDHQGGIVLKEGLVRPEDRAALQDAAAAQRAESGEEPEIEMSRQKVKGVHSEKLVRQLTAHRTAAMHVMAAQNTSVALVILAHRLALQVFDFGVRAYDRPDSVAKINLTQPYVSKEGDDVKESLALAKMAEAEAAWGDLMPTNAKDLFDWLMEQEQQVVLDLLAFCTAASIDTVQSSEDKNPAADQVAKALNLDMADWWQPTRSTYFSQVSKQHIISLVSSEVSPEIAAPMAVLKKIPLTEAAEQNMKDKRWLPTILKAA